MTRTAENPRSSGPARVVAPAPDAPAPAPPAPAPPAPAAPRSRPTPHRPSGAAGAFLLTLELVTGLLAVIGGALLVLDPSGSVLDADPGALSGTPFPSWRVPGLLLLTVVGCGYLLCAVAEIAGAARARLLSVTAGLGLIGFEAAEFAWLGPQPLEFAFVVVGCAVALLAVRAHRW